MKYFFLFLLLTQFSLIAGSFSSTKNKSEVDNVVSLDQKMKRADKTKEKAIIQITPIKNNTGKSDNLLREQLTKMAIRHISRVPRYTLALGQLFPNTSGKTRFETLEISMTKSSSYKLVFRIFETHRNTLVRKVEKSNLTQARLLQNAELMFQDLFISEFVKESRN